MNPLRLQSRHWHCQSRSGIALIIVLTCLIFLSALLLAFLSSVKTELTSSKVYADNASVLALVDNAVSIVMSQIRQATTANTDDCWISQPGLIRTFGNTGAPDHSYKLYSSDVMQKEGALDPSAEASQLANWFQKTAVYTDLNQPVSGVYPILNPIGTSGTVQGFSITTSAPVTASQAVPMPVRWLYLLNDGTLVSATPSGTGNTATISGATVNNPIVGRIAFWTDDESCKVNINTASEGCYWDVPHFESQTDVNLGVFQPVKNEFQGYPGHPAGVNLSTVFPTLTTSTAGHQYDAFYAIAPRIQPGGSFNFTVTASMSLSPPILDADRLYTSPEELLFTSTYSSSARQTTASIGQDDIERAKFFITAHSRAPETTPFGTPKVVCWPISEDLAKNPNSPYASAFDRLISLCGTVKKKPYYFQRKNKDSTTYDANIQRNQQLYAYLQNLLSRPVPGFGGTLSTKFGADTDQILTEIFDYIRCTNLNDLNLSAASSAGVYRYGDGQYQYGFGQGEVAPITIGTTRGFGRFVTFNEVGLWFICTADPMPALATPVNSNVTTNLTLPAGILLTKDDTLKTKQIRMEAIVVLDPFTPMHGAVPMRPDIEIFISGLENWTVKGDSDVTPTNFQFPPQSQQTTTQAGVFQLGVTPDRVGITNAGGYMGSSWPLDGRAVRARNGGLLKQDTAFTAVTNAGHVDAPTSLLNEQYPFVSEPVTVNVKQISPTLSFSGGTITVTIRQRTTGTIQSGTPATPGSTIQTLTINFPPTTLPAPSLDTSSTTITTATGSKIISNLWTFQASGSGIGNGRFAVDSAPDYHPSYKGNDIIYSMVAAQGNQTLDPRFVAMTGQDTTGALFSPHPYYISNGISTRKTANSFIIDPIAGLMYGPGSSNLNTGTLAKLSGSAKMPATNNPCPKVPYPATAANVNGDWDNGIGWMPDGGFLNEPDQGVLPTRVSGYGQTPYFSSHMATGGNSAPTSNFTSPSRMIPSPGMFGSLPTTFARSKATGFTTGQGWQTLLFRRQPGHPAYNASNGNFTNDPDYLMMDFFWMPVVEPYAISEPLSTAGKINMNYQIVPFTYIERSTGLYAVLKHEKVISVPTTDYNQVYKNASIDPSLTLSPNEYRHNILIPETLTQFQQRFANTDGTGLYAFRTPSEICDIHLIPDDATSVSTANKSSLDAAMATYWSTHTLTGDNSRERPYTTIYPRLTTRSNTFRVHYRVQTLKTAGKATPDQWREGTDLITGEGRGSVLIERFVDPSDSNLVDYAANPTTSLEPRYQFRIVGSNRFSP
jgi:hypothetical protein